MKRLGDRDELFVDSAVVLSDEELTKRALLIIERITFIQGLGWGFVAGLAVAFTLVRMFA